MIKTEQEGIPPHQENVEMLQAKKEEDPVLPQSSDSLIKKFTQLWFACYFEKKLTRQRI